MGYETKFSGSMTISPPLSDEDFEFLRAFNLTRHYQRNVDDKFGMLGELYVEEEDSAASSLFTGKKDPIVVDYNTPPPTQPSLWCGWYPDPNDRDSLCIEDGKTYCYTEWLEYIIKNFLAPKGYTVNGCVQYEGEEFGDIGYIEAKDNKVMQIPATLAEW